MTKILTCIACDLIRAEAGGKLMCLGIYPGGLVATANFGIPAYLSFYAEVLGDRTEAIDTWYQFRDLTSNTQLAYGQLRLQTQANVVTPVYTAPLPIPVTGPSSVMFEWTIANAWAPAKLLSFIRTAN